MASSSKKFLTEQQLQDEIEKIMNGKDDSDLDVPDDVESEWDEVDNLEVENDCSDSGESDIEENDIIEETFDRSTDGVREEEIQLLDNLVLANEESSSSSDDNIPLSCLRDSVYRKRYVITSKSINLKGKNGHKWSCKLPQRSKRTASRNLIHFVLKPRGGAENCINIIDYILNFFSNEILDTIIRYTNEEIARQSKNYTENTSFTATLSKEELLALFAVLVMSAVKKDNHLNAKHMFDSTISGSFYKSCMSCERFIFLINSLRFDDKSSRTERVKKDAFAHIREIWDAFITKCRSSYIPSSYLTIDEQLLGFRGRCPFRMYIPNKPSKYGVKIVMLCDSSSKYMIDASPYLGKSTETNGLPLSEYYVKELTKSVHGSNRNITMDN